jgi:glycosyltransferase involved in cell wall biosynthesis
MQYRRSGVIIKAFEQSMGEYRPNASVVVPVYNAEKTLDTCIRSLLNLEYPAECELVVVNNGSTDGSARILKSFGDKIRILQESRRGAAAARNCGIRAARFPVVAFTDSDCSVDPHWLSHLVAPLADPNVGVSGGTIRSPRPCNPVEAYGDNVHDNSKAISFYRPPYVDTANWASRKTVLEELHGFDENFLRCQDVELSCRILQAGFRLAHAPEAVVYHRNESTYWGLCREGFTHGLHGIAVIERHRAFYRSFDYRPTRLKHYRFLLTDARDCIAGANRQSAACDMVFNASKRLGRLAGSIRHGAFHL